MLIALLDCLMSRQVTRSASRPGYEPAYTEVDDGMALLFRKLVSLEMTSEEEEKIVVCCFHNLIGFIAISSYWHHTLLIFIYSSSIVR